MAWDDIEHCIRLGICLIGGLKDSKDQTGALVNSKEFGMKKRWVTQLCMALE